MNDIEQLLTALDAFAALTGRAEATVSVRFLGRSSRIRELRAGGDMGVLRFRRAMRELSAVWPDGAEWPAGVIRPSAAGED